jgi:transmembrane sensor
MTFKEFNKMLERYSRGESSKEETDVIEKWYSSLGQGDTELLNEHQRIVLEQKMRERLNGDKREIPKNNQRFLRSEVYIGVAAALLILAVSFLFLISQPSTIGGGKESTYTSSIPDSDVQTIINSTADPKKIVLEDGSQVILETGGELHFTSKNFNKNRQVYLSGNAFFEVVKDKQHPFFVYTGDLLTRVLGTSFRVNAPRGKKEIVVSVKTGRVSVSAPANESVQEMILTPNQKAVYSAVDVKILKSLVEDPEVVKPDPSSQRHYQNTPVAEIFEALEKNYGIEIDFNDEAFANCSITTTIADENFFQKLEIICEAIGAEYEITETSILINGKGCN